MITCVIVEDLALAAEFLKNCCDKIKTVEVKGHFTNVKDALAYLDDNLVDLIFLDVEMPDADGFHLLHQLSFQPKVILTTSKTEYAYSAFEHNVTDFLKKPFPYDRFAESIKKVTIAMESEKELKNDHLFIKSEGNLVKLQIADILYVESMGDYVKFVTADKKYVAHHTMKSMEEKLDAEAFMKVHRSYIINLSRVDHLRDNIVVIHGDEIPVSKANKQAVLQRINVL